jgi:heme oxygenase
MLATTRNANPTSTGTVLKYVREVTKPAHIALEGALGLLDENLALPAYERVLKLFYGFWRSWEPQMACLLKDEALLGPRRRLHLLAADLVALGVTVQALDALAPCPPTPLQDDVEALGSLYVMEGSTLGGRVIRRNVERVLGDKGRAGCSYFNGYGERTGAMWLSFLDRLDKVPLANAERTAAGALATFEHLGCWIMASDMVD